MRHGAAPTPGRSAGVEAPMPGRFAETVGLDDSFDIFFLGRIPTLARAPMPGRWRGREASMPAGGAAEMWRARHRSLYRAGM